MTKRAIAAAVLCLAVLAGCGGSPDYAGEGHGDVVIQVKAGDSAAAIANTLKAAGVIKSVDSFVKAAANDPSSSGIQPGSYHLKLEMSSGAALQLLEDPTKRVINGVTVIEGSRVDDVVDAIVAKSKISRADVEAALAHPEKLGLPSWANNRVEGYLFPATYDVGHAETAEQLLKQMVAKAVEVQKSLGLPEAASKVGLTPGQLVTMASLLQWEGKRENDLPKIARVFYNRLKAPMRLQSDATVAYANGLKGTVWTTPAQRDNPSPYNTYAHDGLPPGPIGSPGENALKVALNPAEGPWLYFVPINLETGETAFATTNDEQNANVAKLHAWCAQTNSPNCD